MDIAEAIESSGDTVRRVVLNGDVDAGLVSGLPKGWTVDRLPGMAGFRPTTDCHAFGFLDPAKGAVLQALAGLDVRFPPVVHATAWVSPRAEMAQGTFVGAQAAVASGARLGDFSSLNRMASLGHDSVLGPHSHLAPAATVSGLCTIGSRVRIGAGATVIDRLSVCDDAVVGAGAVVVRDLVAPGTYVGVPAYLLASPPSSAVR
jgi:sugar O-acyltransferase (sialic acid O-acetyltransferase NeuD family)